jgi:hypothetical protein
MENPQHWGCKSTSRKQFSNFDIFSKKLIKHATVLSLMVKNYKIGIKHPYEVGEKKLLYLNIEWKRNEWYKEHIQWAFYTQPKKDKFLRIVSLWIDLLVGTSLLGMNS